MRIETMSKNEKSYIARLLSCFCVGKTDKVDKVDNDNDNDAKEAPTNVIMHQNKNAIIEEESPNPVYEKQAENSCEPKGTEMNYRSFSTVRANHDIRLSADSCRADTSGAFMCKSLPWNSPILNLDGYRGWARLHDIYDGDTCTVIVPIHGMGPRRIHVRLEGINAPEMRSTTEAEQANAKKARASFCELVCPGLSMLGTKDSKAFLSCKPILVWIECRSNDKYGRTIAKVYPCTVDYTRATDHVSQTLVRLNLARVFMPFPDTFPTQ